MAGYGRSKPMENWIIISKFGILLYCCIKYVESGMGNKAGVIFFILVHIILNMLYYVLKPAVLKLLMAFASTALLVYCFFNINMLFVLFIPMGIFDIIHITLNDMRLAAVALLPYLAMPSNIMAEYTLILLLGFALDIVAHKASDRIRQLSLQNDGLREKIDDLYREIDKTEEFQKQVKYLSQLEERNSIAQEIHDKVGHAISGSLIQLEAAVLLVDKDKERSKGIMRNVINILREGMENIRATLHNIKPPAEQLGINRLKSLLDEFTFNNGIRTSLTYSGNLGCITHMQWKAITDNTVEALTNAVKHSKCTAVSVRVDVLNKIIKAEVRDNGRGALNIKKGLGLKGIEERSGSIGGKVIIDGSKGFSIITILPIEGGSNGN